MMKTANGKPMPKGSFKPCDTCPSPSKCSAAGGCAKEQGSRAGAASSMAKIAKAMGLAK